MSESSSHASARGGVGFLGLLTIVFIVLKLIGIISWSWIWVLAPLWMGFVLGIIILLICIPIFIWANN